MVRVIAQAFPRTILYRGDAETIDGARGAVILSLGLHEHEHDWRDETGRIVWIYYRTGPRETFLERIPFIVIPCPARLTGTGSALEWSPKS